MGIYVGDKRYAPYIGDKRRRYMGGVKKENPYAEYMEQYLTMEMLDSGTISVVVGRTLSDRTVSYSINGGAWVDNIYLNADNSQKTYTTPSLSAGDKVRWKCVSSDGTFSKGYGVVSYFSSTATCNIYGNILSLVYGDSFIGKSTLSSGHIFRETLKNGLKCVSAENLIFPVETVNGYVYMESFYRNTYLEKGPVFISTTINGQAFQGAFDGCTSLASLAILADTVNTSQNNWARNVPSGGVLTKKKGTTWNLLPSGWTINYISI